MATPRRWWARIRALLLHDRFDRELRDEMRFHLEMETRRRVAAGQQPEAARRAALRAFGGVQRFRQQVHQERWGAGLEALARDVRLGLRSLRASPGYSAVTVATMALAVGANSAVFSVVQASLLRALPYPEPERVVELRTSWESQPDAGMSPAEFLDYAGRLPSLAAVGAYSLGGLTLQESEGGERVTVAGVTAGVLPALGVEPALGRGFTEQDGLADDLRLLVTHGFWQGRLGGAPDVIGREIRVSGSTARVLGVLPATFRFPDELFASTRVDALLPTAFAPEEITNRGSHYLANVARLAPGVTLARADAELHALVDAMHRENPGAYPAAMRFDVRLAPLRERVVGEVRPALLLLQGAVAFILLVAAANLAALGLSRYEARQRELALRAALGAGRGRLVSHVLIECLLLSILGGLAGIGLGGAGVEALLALAPGDLPRLDEVAVDGTVLGLGLGLSLLAGLGFGLVPALGARPDRLREALRSGGRAGGDRRGQRLRQALVVTQLGVAVVLLGGAGLLGRSLVALLAVDPGFTTGGLMTARVGLPSASYPDDEARFTFFRDLVHELEARPGVVRAGAVTNLPLATSLGDMNLHIEGRAVGDDEVDPAADWQAVVPGYLEAMEIRPLRGRLLEFTDTAGAAGVVVVNETFAAAFFPGEEVLGKRFTLGGGAGPGTVTVVGVVPDVTHAGLDAAPVPQMYLAHEQFRYWGSGRAVGTMSLVLRSSRPPGEAAGLLRDTVREIDPSLAVFDVRSMRDVRSRAIARPRFLALLMAAFAVASLALAGVGVYGVMSYSVAVRARELGIRMALGARAADVVGMVVIQAARLLALGLAGGTLVALAGVRAASGLLFETSPGDPTTLFGVLAVLAAVTLAGAWVPAARACRQSIGRLLLRD